MPTLRRGAAVVTAAALGAFVCASTSSAQDAATADDGATGSATREPTSPARPDYSLLAPSGSGERFEFHGYLRAPMRVGFGEHPNPSPGQARLQLHASPLIPDGNYTNWTFTNNLPNPWTELHFSYGSATVRGTVSIESWNLSESGWRDSQAQLGITRAFLTFDLPEVMGTRAHLKWNVGSLADRYGAAGPYDAGRYDTYLFGRTRVVGETLVLLVPVSADWSLHFEHGVGGKLERPPSAGADPNLQYEVGSTFLHHAHLGAMFRRLLQVNAHYLHTFTQDLRGSGTNPDAHMEIAGAEARFNGGAYGYGYLGYSLIRARHIRPLADAVEVLHSFGGQQFMGNYLGLGGEGTGAVQSLLWQYTFSFAAFARHPEGFWGQGPDLAVTLFGMWNAVTSRQPAFDGKQRLKWGADALYTPLSWLGAGLRYDLVSPDMSDGSVAFSVLSPRLVLRTEFLAKEQVTLQYVRYFHRSNVVAAWPNAGAVPDGSALLLMATMWW